MANEVQLRVNDAMRTVTAAPDTPLLYVLTDDLALQGPRFGCGLGQCGCCSGFDQCRCGRRLATRSDSAIAGHRITAGASRAECRSAKCIAN